MGIEGDVDSCLYEIAVLHVLAVFKVHNVQNLLDHMLVLQVNDSWIVPKMRSPASHHECFYVTGTHFSIIFLSL